MVFQGEEQGKLKPLVLGLDGHGAAVFLGSVAHALQSVAVVLPVGLGGHWQTVIKDGGRRAVVFTSDDQKVLLGVELQMNEPLFLIRDRQLTLNGVVQGVAEEGADVHHVHKGQPGPVGHAGELDLVLGAVETILPVSTVSSTELPVLVLGLVVLDLLLHLVQEGGAAGGVLLGPKDSDLVLQVVVLTVDDVDGLPGLAVLYILVLQDVFDGVQLPAGVQLKELDVVG